MLHLPRKMLRLIEGVYTGHNCLNKHLSVLELINSPKCGNCNEADKTALHYLCYCSHYGAVRTRIWGKPFLHPSVVLHITVRNLLRLLTSSRRFSYYPGKKYQGLYWAMGPSAAWFYEGHFRLH